MVGQIHRNDVIPAAAPSPNPEVGMFGPTFTARNVDQGRCFSCPTKRRHEIAMQRVRLERHFNRYNRRVEEGTSLLETGHASPPVFGQALILRTRGKGADVVVTKSPQIGFAGADQMMCALSRLGLCFKPLPGLRPLGY